MGIRLFFGLRVLVFTCWSLVVYGSRVLSFVQSPSTHILDTEQSNQRTMPKLRILSIDGGGIRGILPGRLLCYIEEQLQQRSGNAKARLSDYIDLFAGTSTGGILSCIYLMPGDDGRPRFSAQEAVDLYLKNGEQIFKRNRTSLGGVLDEQYDARPLKALLKDYMQEIKLSQALRPCLITAYDIERRKAHFFTSMDARTRPTHNFYMRDVARATSAAPTYFEPEELASIYGSTYALVDGGVFANNPALCAYSEARTQDFPGRINKPTAENMVIISLGTGAVNTPYSYEKAKDWGKLQWIQPIIDILMSGSAETVDYHLRQIFDSQGVSRQYERIQPDLFDASNDMSETDPKNIQALDEAGLNNVAKYQNQLDRMVDLLMEVE